MARTLHRLTDRFVRSSQLKTGRHGDGGGLYLNVKEGGSKSWIFLFKRDGVRRAAGLGSYPAVGLAAARGKAAELRGLIAEGGDPQAPKNERLEPTFAECVDRFLESMEGQWRNEKHRAQWRSTLGASYCGLAVLAGLPAGRLVDRFGAGPIMLIGLGALLVGCLGLALFSGALDIAGYVVVVGTCATGYAVFQAANNTAIMRDVGPDRRGVISGLLNLSRNLGLISGASVMGALFASLSGTGNGMVADPMLVARGMALTFAVAAGLGVVAMVLAALASRRP